MKSNHIGSSLIFAQHSCKSKPHRHEYNDNPSRTAYYSYNGGTLELVDGDSGFVNSVTSFKLCAFNAMYGTNMKTYHGCCTRGINIVLIHSGSAWHSKVYYVLLMDTEITGSRQLLRELGASHP